jgi:cytochrome c nitrite reductase small subunit
VSARAITSWVLGILAGLTAGVGVFTFHYAKGASYFGHEPSACANCHVMQGQFDGWIKSSHRAVAACNDCHAPHGLLPKFAVKGLNGFRHSLAFTLGGFHEPISITPLNRRVTEEACRHCHEDVTASMLALASGHGGGRGDVSCIRCHGSVGHPTGSAIAQQQER